MSEFSVDEFILESNAIEGILGDCAGKGSLYFDQHLEAYRYCVCAVSRSGVTQRVLKETHLRLLTGLDASAGKFRSNPLVVVRVGGYVAPPTHRLKALLSSFCSLAEKAANESDCWDAHLFFESVHPFYDGNGRTGRCVLNAMLLNLGYVPVIIRREDRFDYYRKIESWREINPIK